MLDETLETQTTTGLRLEQSLDSSLDGFFAKVNTAMDMVGAQLIDTAPAALDGLLKLIQFKGIFELSITLAAALVFVIIPSIFLKKLWLWGRDLCDETEGGSLAPPVLVTIFVLIAGILVFTHLADFEMWVAIIYPEGALALRALEAVGIIL